MEKILLELGVDAEALRSPTVRYDVIQRLIRACEQHGVVLLAFGLGVDELRAVVDADTEAIDRLITIFKRSACRCARMVVPTFAWGHVYRDEAGSREVEEAVAWAHTVPWNERGPLANPWTSHRDLMGVRRTDFDLGPLLERVDPARVHRLAGGAKAASPRALPRRPALTWLLRVAADVLGLLPSDRRCFRLFVHLGKDRGWRNPELARALALTERRIRQLSAASEPALSLALGALRDPRVTPSYG